MGERVNYEQAGNAHVFRFVTTDPAFLGGRENGKYGLGIKTHFAQ
jgi:hypothetical protein